MRFPGFEGEWVLIKLRDIAEIKTGPFGSTLHAEDYVSDGTPIITTEHFKTGSLPIEKSGLPQVSPTDYLRLKSYRLSINDIVFSRVGSVDINAHVNKEQEGWLFSGRVLRVRPNSSINSNYLHWCLSTEKNRANIARRAVGQTMPSINTEILNETELFISDSHREQDKIANILTLVDERISIQNKVIKKYESLIKALAYENIGRYSPNTTLSECVQCSSSTIKEGDLFDSGTIPAYGASGISGYMDNALSENDSILITKDGSGFGSLRYVNGPHSFVGTLNSMTPKEGVYLPYIYYALQNVCFESYRTGQAIPHIYFKDYGKETIYCPSLDNQKRLAKGLEMIDTKIGIDRAVLHSLQSAKAYLLSAMFI